MPIACVVSIVIGYLIGSIVPAYFFGKLKRMDIREHGARYAGTLNVYHTIGLLPAIPTALFDTIKGVVAICVAHAIGVPFFCAQLSGIAAIAGHIFPFYIKFRGGQGTACAVGILLYYMTQCVSAEPFFFYLFGVILILVIIFGFVARSGEVVGLIVLPFLCAMLIVHDVTNPYNIFLVLVIVHINGVGIYNTVTRKLIQIQDKTFREHWWRVALRPGAIAFILFYLYWPQRRTLVLIGCVALLFIALDVLRFVHRQTNDLFKKRVKSFFKRGEYRRFSSMTMFLVAAFITVLVFQKDVGITALSFLIFGDIFGKLFGLGFGRQTIFHKTIEGTLAYLGCTLICAFILYTLLGFPLFMLIIGAVAATVAEFTPLGLDDNFTVGIVSGAVMTVVRLFGP
jgi:glycerol-3-phosphate acyltransferase PlsY